MKLIKEEKINKKITQKYSSDFVLADDGLYLIEIIASAKSWWQNLKSFKSLFKDDDLTLIMDRIEITTSMSNKTDVRPAWHGNELKGLLKTVVIAVKLKKGKHVLNFIPDQSPYLKSIIISQVEEINVLTYIPVDNNPPQTGDIRPWLSFITINLTVKNLTISAKADKRGRDDDDIKIIIDGEIQKNQDKKSHQDWYWCGKVLKGEKKEFKKSVNFNGGMHIVDFWTDETPFLEKVEIFLTEKNAEKIIKPYSFRGSNNQEDYNRYDEMIGKVVNFWNGEFLKEPVPPEEILDPNLVKAIIFQESRVGYDDRNNGSVNIMQVGNYGDASLDVLNGKGKKMEYELKNGRLWGVNYKGEAKVEKAYDSIYWGVRWLYHKVQSITTDNKRYWLSWHEAVKRYGPPNDKYVNNIWDIYTRGIDKRGRSPLKLWIITFFIIFSSLIFSIDVFHNRTIKSIVMATMSDDDKTYFNDVEITRYAPDSPLFLAVMVHDDDWWENLKVGLYQNGAIKWLAIEMAPLEDSILAAKFLRLKGFENPLVEVYGQTHAGHGDMYLYEVENDQLALLFQITAVDINPDSRWAPDNHEKYGYGSCGEVFAGGQLAANYSDINDDGYPEIILSGRQNIICDEEVYARYVDRVDEIKVASLPVKKVFLWDKNRQSWRLK